MLISLLLLACTGSRFDDTGTPADTDTDTDADTDTDTDTDTDVSLNHGILVLTVADRGDGFDLDGDGRIDNALWTLGTVVDPLFASLLSSTTRVPVIQLADVDDTAAPYDDSDVQLALVSGDDTDGDPSDNGSGSEVYTAGAAVDANGRALVGTPTALASSVYSSTLLDTAFTVGSFTLQSTTPIYISGTIVGQRHDGLIGFGVATDALIAAFTAAGSPDAADLVEAIADLDTDADGQADAVSMAFSYEATACGLTP